MEEGSMERQQEIQRHTEGELPEVKIFDLLSSVGNGEHKALELIVMGKGMKTYSKRGLWHEVMNNQTKNKRWNMDIGLPFDHCQYSLSPIGLVTRETLRSDDTAWGYGITEYGIKTGIPFAGLLLKWSYEHPEHSLYKMFGATTSSSVKDERTFEKKRAPETRHRIFRELATSQNDRIRLTDIANAINEDNNLISVHLSSLRKNGIITYDVTEAGKPFLYYRKKTIVPDKEQEPYMHQKTLSAAVYDLLTHEYLSREEVVNLVINKYPRYGDLERESLSGDVGKTLSHFATQGYLERKKFSKDFQSQVTLSGQQRETIASLVTLIDNFKNGDKQTIDKGREFAKQVASDPNLFSELMLKAKEASPNANNTNREEMNRILLSVLQDHPNSTINQLMQILEEDYDKRLTHTGVHKNLSRLAEKDLIISEKTKSGNIYRVADSDNKTVPSN